MNEKLIIKNFGPIKDVELDLRKINIFIGDQGTGKSTVAKVLYIVKNASNNHGGNLSLRKRGYEISDISEINKYRNDEFRADFIELLTSLDIYSYLNNASFINFSNSLCEVIIEGYEIQFKPKAQKDEDIINKNTNLNYYIPAFRESYILLRNNYPAILNAKANLPFLLNALGQYFNNFREKQLNFNYNSILNVTYSFKNGRDIILLENGQEITFEESSSAINSVVPMLVVTDGICKEMSQGNYRVLYPYNQPFITIEEPELNCFPLTQNEIIKHLIQKLTFNDNSDFLCNLLITTHSPYILTSLNNLMYAYQVGQNSEVEVEQIIPSKYWVNPKEVSCYLLKDGKAELIMDYNEGMIKAELLDGVSTLLNKEFDDLINIEIKIEELNVK